MIEMRDISKLIICFKIKWKKRQSIGYENQFIRCYCSSFHIVCSNSGLFHIFFFSKTEKKAQQTRLLVVSNDLINDLRMICSTSGERKWNEKRNHRRNTKRKEKKSNLLLVIRINGCWILMKFDIEIIRYEKDQFSHFYNYPVWEFLW